MAGKKKSLNHLYTEIQTLKDIHDKEIKELKKIIKQQDDRIKDIEKVAASYGLKTIGFRRNLKPLRAVLIQIQTFGLAGRMTHIS